MSYLLLPSDTLCGMFHRHRWTEVHRRAVPGAMEVPDAEFKFGGGFMGPEARAALYGVTFIEQRCSGCGEQRITHHSGCMPGVRAPDAS